MLLADSFVLERSDGVPNGAHVLTGPLERRRFASKDGNVDTVDNLHTAETGTSSRQRRYGLPPLNSLRAFEAAARNMSFTRAAAELCVTQGAISRHILILEAYLGAKLFIRSHREVVLTPVGQAYLDSVRKAFEEIDTSTSQIRANPGNDTLKIRLLPTFAMRWLVPRLAHFNARHPEVTVRINTSHSPVNFDREDFDASVEYGRAEDMSGSPSFILGEYLLPVCSPRLANGEMPPLRPEDFPRHRLLHSLQRPDFWRQWLEEAGVHDAPIDNGLRFENSGLVYQAAVDGLGIAIAQLAFVAGDLEAGRLIVPYWRPVLNREGYYLVLPANKLRHEKLALFRRWITEEASQTASWVQRVLESRKIPLKGTGDGSQGGTATNSVPPP